MLEVILLATDYRGLELNHLSTANAWRLMAYTFERNCSQWLEGTPHGKCFNGNSVDDVETASSAAMMRTAE